MYNIEEFTADENLLRRLKDCISNPGADGVLRSAKMKVTPRCNLRCRMCSYWRYESQPEMSTERLLSLIDELADMGVRKIHFSGGEPLLRSDIFDAIGRCTARKIRANITTNGTMVDHERAKMLVKSGARSVSVSIDGPTAKVHDQIRGVDGAFKKAVSAVERLAEARDKYSRRKRMRIRINTVLQRDNWRHLPEIVRLAGKLGADEMHPMPVDPKKPAMLIKKSEIKDFNLCIAPEVETLRIRLGFSTDPLLVYPFGQSKDDINHAREGRYALGFFDEHLCYVPWLHLFIAWNGDVYPCCMTRGRVKSLGNLIENSVEEVFTGEEYSRLRRVFIRNRLPECARCDNFLHENHLLVEALEKPSQAA